MSEWGCEIHNEYDDNCRECWLLHLLDKKGAEIKKLKGEIERSKWMPFESEYEQAIKHADKLAEALTFYQVRSNVPLKELCEAYEKQGSTLPILTEYTKRASEALAEYRKFRSGEGK